MVNEEDAQDALNILMEDIETVLDDKGLLSGSKSTVLNAPNADYFIVFSKKGGDFCFSLVSKDAEGLNLKR